MQEQPGPGGGQSQEGRPPQEQPAPPPPAPPAAQPPAAPQQAEGIRQRDSGFVWALGVFTGGIYGAIWYYQLCKELGEWSRGRIETDPVQSVLAVTIGGIIIVPPIISWVGTMERIRQAQEMAGVEVRANFWGGVGRLLLFGYAYYWLQEQLNELSARQPA